MLENGLTCIIAGGIRINALALREALKKDHYWLVYDPHTCTATLSKNHGPAHDLMTLTNVSHETAARFGEELGLTSPDKKKSPCHWSKWNPHFRLEHNGTPDADMLHEALLKLGIPCTLVKNCKELALTNQRGRHVAPYWTPEMLLGIIRETAAHNAEELATTP